MSENAYRIVMRHLFKTGRFKSAVVISTETGLGIRRVNKVLGILAARGYVIRWGFIYAEYILNDKALPLCERMFPDMEKPEFWDVPF